MTSAFAASALAVVSGALYFLGFAGFDLWPLAFVSLVPLLFALRGREPRAAFALGWLSGVVLHAGGFYWLVPMLRAFSSFGRPTCFAIAALFDAVHGLAFGVFAWLVVRADRRGVSRWASVPLALVAIEFALPRLFPAFTGNSLHRVLPLVQIADLGGVLLVSAVIAFTYATVEDALVRRDARIALVTLAVWVVCATYGVLRIHAVDRENAHAPALRVAVVQENLGLEAREIQPLDAIARHLARTRTLEHDAHPDLVVWSESAVDITLPHNARAVRDWIPTWDLHVPVLFGALSRRGDDDFNSAMMVDASGRVVGIYDKVHLLAFGEYMPLGKLLPSLYALSPRTSSFTPGATLSAMPLPGDTLAHPRRIATLICYEDVLPGFVRDVERATDASLLAVILNDAWFGDTAEPWIHLALARFRAIELRRDVVRAANSGVSALVDAAGRIDAASPTFARAAPVGTVHLREGRTLYVRFGDWVGWLALAALAYLLALAPLLDRRARHEQRVRPGRVGDGAAEIDVQH